MSIRNKAEDNNPPLRTSTEDVRAVFIPTDRPTHGEVTIVGAISAEFSDLAALINENVSDSPDKSHALRVLKDAAMWTNVAITNHP